jgi:hypothetical protein
VVPPGSPTELAGALAAITFQLHDALYQGVAAEADLVHQLFAMTLGLSSASYAAVEGANMGTLT